MTDDQETQALATVPPPRQFSDEQVQLIKRTIAPKASDDELALFLEVCRGTGLNPFMKQIYAIKRGDKMTIQTGIDGYRLLAARTGQLAGIDDATFDTEEEEHPNKASVTVWRFVAGQRVPFSATARWKEYKPSSSEMWGKMPYLMLAKCAEALALRKAFPAELSGIYTGEEMAQAEESEEAIPPRPLRAVDAAPKAPVGRPYNPLQDKTLRQALNRLGCRSVAEVEEFVADVRGIYGEVSARTCMQHADHLESLVNAPESLEALAVGERGN